MFPTISEIIFFGLVCWRITSLLVNEDGPLDMFIKLRVRIGVYYDAFSVAQGKNVIAKGLTCVWCTSIWVSIPLAVLYEFARTTQTSVGTIANSAKLHTLSPPALEFLIISCFALAISAVAILIDRAHE